jgi:hypothetical protein
MKIAVSAVWRGTKRLDRSWRKVMNKTNNVSKLGHGTKDRGALADNELDVVTGGTSLEYGGIEFEYTPQKPSGAGPETVTIWGIVLTVPQRK